MFEESLEMVLVHPEVMLSVEAGEVVQVPDPVPVPDPEVPPPMFPLASIHVTVAPPSLLFQQAGA